MCSCYVHKYKSKAKYRHVQCVHVLYTNIKVKLSIDMCNVRMLCTNIKVNAKYRHVQYAHVLYTNIKVKPRIDSLNPLHLFKCLLSTTGKIPSLFSIKFCL